MNPCNSDIKCYWNTTYTTTTIENVVKMQLCSPKTKFYLNLISLYLQYILFKSNFCCNSNIKLYCKPPSTLIDGMGMVINIVILWCIHLIHILQRTCINWSKNVITWLRKKHIHKHGLFVISLWRNLTYISLTHS